MGDVLRAPATRRRIPFDPQRLDGQRLPPRPERYFLSVNHDKEFVVSPGFIYVLPGATFRVEPPWSGVLSTAQWVSTEPVRPYFRLAVDPSDYPLTKHIIRHHSGDPVLRTIWKSRVKRAR
ncbi:MAG: hypothetical protein ACR2F6_10345 [Mycobacteriales bacterium]